MFVDKINELIESGLSCKEEKFYDEWTTRVEQILIAGLNQEMGREFTGLKSYNVWDGYKWNWNWKKNRPKHIGFLEGLALKASIETMSNGSDEIGSNKNTTKSISYRTNKVFIVHGHDVSVKESVARYIEQIGLDPIILHEQPNSGRTIIEKFEVYSDVGFAVILLTPDDIGAPGDNKDDFSKRARQNVIMELGYFLGKLGRDRVCALYKKGVEIPSDYQGVLYTEFDSAEGWKIKLAQELNECGFSLNIGAILGK